MPNPNRHPSKPALDEHQLARLLSGTIEESERRTVLARLAQDPEARILLAMAIEALEAADQVPTTRNTGSKHAA